MFEKHQNKHFWQFLTTLRAVLVEKGPKTAQNTSKIAIFAHIAKISIFDVFWAVLGPFSTKTALKVVGNCQKYLFWCFSNIFDTFTKFYEGYPSHFHNRPKSALWGGAFARRAKILLIPKNGFQNYQNQIVWNNPISISIQKLKEFNVDNIKSKIWLMSWLKEDVYK